MTKECNNENRWIYLEHNRGKHTGPFTPRLSCIVVWIGFLSLTLNEEQAEPIKEWDQMGMMVNCKLDWIFNHLEDRGLGCLWESFQRGLSEKGRLTLMWVAPSHVRILDWIREGEKRSIPIVLLPGWGHRQVHSCHDGLFSLKLWVKITLSSPKLLSVRYLVTASRKVTTSVGERKIKYEKPPKSKRLVCTPSCNLLSCSVHCGN